MNIYHTEIGRQVPHQQATVLVARLRVPYGCQDPNDVALVALQVADEGHMVGGQGENRDGECCDQACEADVNATIHLAGVGCALHPGKGLTTEVDSEHSCNMGCRQQDMSPFIVVCILAAFTNPYREGARGCEKARPRRPDMTFRSIEDLAWL